MIWGEYIYRITVIQHYIGKNSKLWQTIGLLNLLKERQICDRLFS